VVDIKKKAIKKPAKGNEIYKQLTSFLFRINEDELDKFIESQDWNTLNNHIYRLINLLSGHGKVNWFINKYLNHLYMEWDFKSMVYTLNAIAKAQNITSTNQLKFARFKKIDRDAIYSTLITYLKDTNQEYTERDLACLYTLVETGKIDRTVIEQINQTVSGKTISTKKDDVKIEVPVKQHKDNEEILTFKKDVEKYIRNRAACNGCPLQRDGFLITTTNLTRPGPVDVLFVGEGASVDELTTGVHGLQAGEILRQICDSKKLTYAFINLTMCNTAKATTAAKLKQSINSCETIVGQLKELFKPTIQVIVGDKVRTYYGIKGGRCTALNGKIYDNKIVMVNYDKFANKYMTGFVASFEAFLNTTTFKKKEEEPVIINLEENDNKRIVSAVSADLLLFDIKEVGDKILYIFTNSEGEKVYYIETPQIEVYIKDGSMRNCEYIDSIKGADRCVLNLKQLQQLKRQFYSMR